MALLASQAGCNGQDTCRARVYGIRPSSLLPLCGVIGGLTFAVFMPVTGALIDFTPHRRRTGVITVVIVSLVNVLQATLLWSTDSWFAVALLHFTISLGCVLRASFIRPLPPSRLSAFPTHPHSQAPNQTYTCFLILALHGTA